ncbi:MAG: ABC transporter permease [Fimbriimonadaceae bacterium]|nr:ABC transporter permease [Fimbriimonadaceae bacterium]
MNIDGIAIWQYATPVAVAALGETVAQRTGVIHIGLEGAMLVGAFFGMLAAYTTGSPWVGVMAAMLAGTALSAIFAWLTVLRAADQVVVGTAINLFALGITGTLYRSQFGQSGKILSVPKLPVLAGRIDAVQLLTIIATIGIALMFRLSALGLAMRSAGEYPKATESAGFSALKLRMAGTLVSGALGGLAGAYLSLGIAGAFAENMTAGRGFLAIAMVTFGRWNAVGVVGAALLVGFADSLQYSLQAGRSVIPFQLLIALPYLVALLVLIFVGKGTRAPAALGQAYRKEGTA